jgi:hypothetical protein
VRARVPVMLSDTEAVDLYNRVNTSSLRRCLNRKARREPGGAGRVGGQAWSIPGTRCSARRPAAPAAARLPAAPFPAEGHSSSPTAVRPDVAPRLNVRERAVAACRRGRGHPPLSSCGALP